LEGFWNVFGRLESNWKVIGKFFGRLESNWKVLSAGTLNGGRKIHFEVGGGKSSLDGASCTKDAC
jgi:hypothetical protein